MDNANNDSQSTEEVQPEQIPGTEANTLNEGDLVAKKLIDENRRYRKSTSEARAEAAKMKLELERFQEAKFQEEGKHKEAAEFYKQKSDELEKTLKDSTASYASRIVTSQVKAKAAEMGCIDSEALLQLAPMADLYDDIDDDYNIKPTAVQDMLEMMAQTKSYLFKKNGPKIEDGNPSQTIASTSSLEGKSILEMARIATAKLK